MNSKFVQDYFNEVRQLRKDIVKMGLHVQNLINHPGLYGINAPGEDRAEAKANVMLAFRDTQAAALRLSQSLHAMGGGCDASTQEKCCGAPVTVLPPIEQAGTPSTVTPPCRCGTEF